MMDFLIVLLIVLLLLPWVPVVVAVLALLVYGIITNPKVSIPLGWVLIMALVVASQ